MTVGRTTTGSWARSMAMQSVGSARVHGVWLEEGRLLIDRDAGGARQMGR